MQALLLYAMFGSMLAALAGVVSMTVDTTQQYMLNQRAMTAQYFRDIENILTNVVVPQNMQIPNYTTCPDGSTPGGIAAYLCQREVAQLAQWAGSSGGLRDTWGHPIKGYALRKVTPLYASGSYNVQAPVTAIVLVSGGPDGRINKTLEDAINALDSGDELRDVLRLGPPSAGTCTSNIATGVSCDDIVYTFSNQRAMERRWHDVEGAIERIGAAALRDYQQQFRQFMPQLETIYANNLAELFDASGNLRIDDERIQLWQTQGITGTPTLSSVNLANATDRTRIGVDEEFRYLTTSVANGGSGLALSFAVTNSAYGYRDILTITVANNGSPWGATAGGTLGYRKTVYASGQY